MWVLSESQVSLILVLSESQVSPKWFLSEFKHILIKNENNFREKICPLVKQKNRYKLANISKISRDQI